MQPRIATTFLLICSISLVACGPATRTRGSGPSPSATTSHRSTPTATQQPDIVALLDQGTQMVTQHQFQQAIDTAFDPVIAVFEQQYAEYDGQILCFREPGVEMMIATEEVRQSLGDAVFLGPEWAEALFWKASCLHNLERFDEALAVLQRALAMSPQDVVYLFYLGLIQRDRGDMQAALQAFDDAVASAERLERLTEQAAEMGMSPPLVPLETPDGWIVRVLQQEAKLQVSTGDTTGAAASYRRILEIEPGDQAATDGLAAVEASATPTAPEPAPVPTE